MAERNVEYTREILKSVGMSPERVHMFFCSAAEGQRFQEEVTRISQIIEDLKNNPFKTIKVSNNNANNAKNEKKSKTD
ncbi:MAG: hydrogenase iron-sulfur subunit [Promethearchaeota archaeon]|nr:MAG: hydrogenase iron-sulfur subunit [Candidatus Lokiarchaeota archaeon]